MKKKFIFALFLVTFFLFPMITTYAEPQNGWVKENGETYYYRDGEKVKGFQEIDGKTYFFSEVNNILKTGLQKQNGEISKMFYLNDDGTVYQGWKELDGETYYFGENHFAARGFQEIDGKTYFFSEVNNALKTGLQKQNNDINKMFYLNEDGEVYQGWKKVEGNTYYFGDSYYALKGFQEIEGKTYFFSEVNNVLKTGLQKQNNDINKMFYLNEDGSVYQGWKELDGKTYYFGDNYYAVNNFQTIDNKTYYFNNYELQKGLVNINGKKIYANENGELQYGWQTIDNNKYYFGSDGYALSGFQEIEGKTYFFSEVNNVLKTGLQKQNGEISKMFYLNNDGTVHQGWKELDGETYYFGENHFAVNDFQTIDNKNYYFDNYKLQKGLVNIDSKIIYTNENGELQYGWQTIDNNKYYFGNDGYALNGFQEIDGKTYFFSNINYVLKNGWQTLNENYNQIFYLNMDGTVTFGNQTIEGREYSFGEDGFLDGFKAVGNSFVYYNPDGTMAKGIQRMAGKYYQFNEYTGTFEKYVNQKIVIDVSAHQGEIDWEAVKNSGMVDAVILRAGYGVSWTDDYFQRNVQELNRLGIPYSVYLFSYAENANEASMEADNLINIIKNTGANIASDIFSIYYDLEDWSISSTGENSYGISQQTYQEMFNSFSSKVESALGTDVKIYASKNYIETRFPESLRPEIGWVAQWGPELTYDGTYEGWQYTSDGSVPGINGRVDMSIFYY